MGVHVTTGFGLGSFRFACQGITDPMAITFGFEITGPNLDESPNQTAQGVAGTATPAGKWLNPANYASFYTLLSCDVVIGRLGDNDVGTFPINAVGTLNADPVPPQVALLVRKTTARPGRSGRGRMYLPPMFYPEGSVSAAGEFTPALLNGLQTRLNTWLSDMDVDGYRLYLLHSDPFDVPDMITGLIPQYRTATQRRRIR